MAKQYTYEILGILKRIETKIDRLASHLGIEFFEAPKKEKKEELDLYPNEKEIFKRAGVKYPFKKGQKRSRRVKVNF